MKMARTLVVILCVLGIAQAGVFAGEGGKPWELKIGVLGTYDDNYNYTETDEQDTFGVRIEPEITVNLAGERTLVGFGYMPAAIFWNDRADDDDDFDHDAFLTLSHGLTSRLRVSLADYLRRSENPELIDNGNVVRENGDYWWNSLRLGLNATLSEKLGVQMGGDYQFLRYDEDTATAGLSPSDRLDADTLGADATVWFKVLPKTSVGLAGAAQDQAYQEDAIVDRGSTSYQVGAALSHMVNPNISMRADAGFQTRNFNDAVTDSSDSPYASLNIRINPSPRMQFQLGGGYSLDTTDAYPYTAQQHTHVSASLTYGVTEKLQVGVSGRMDRGEYDMDESAAAMPAVDDGTEDQLGAGVSASLALNRNHSLEVGYDYRDFDTDIVTRVPYTRNLARAGWRMSF
ncbi:MAG: outer membrane beta-barrel protein [Kiritimatiellae bacterium]|nr:outer membrane beta-barrel protein [Kiritimatiellia bacterium]